jgi:hypothetical protein
MPRTARNGAFMSDYITTTALINGEPATVSFTRAFLESLFPDSEIPGTHTPEEAIALEQLEEHLRKHAHN